MTPTNPSSPCGICRLHDDATNVAAYEIARTDLWLLLDARRHVPGPLAFSDREALSWGQAVRHASQLVQQLTGCDRVYAIAFGEGAPHLHLHLIPRQGSDPRTAAWSVADLYRAVAEGKRQAADPQLVRELVARGREWVERHQLEMSATVLP